MARRFVDPQSIDARDVHIADALSRIHVDYGDVCSIERKGKHLHKFGHTNNADSGVKTTVAEFQDNEVNETLASGNTIDSIVSSSTSDTEVVKVEGHTVDTLTGDFTFSTQTVTLTGQTRAPITPLNRCSRIYVPPATYAAPASDLVGNVVVYDQTEATGLTAGKPDVDSSVKCMIVAGQNQSQKCATTISSSDYWIITEIYAGLARSGPANVNADIEVEYKQVGGVWRPLGFEINLSQSVLPAFHDTMLPYLVIPKNSDARMVAISDTANSSLSGYISGYLASVIT
jgi:hypothetical protein